MIYKFVMSETAKKQMAKLDKYTQKQIQKYINTKILNTKNPKQFGKSLERDLKGLWKYRIGDYRLVCYIDDNVFEILAIKVGHRRYIYPSSK